MVYDVSSMGQDMLERKRVQGKLIGIQTDSSKCKVFDQEHGVYSWLSLSLVTGFDEHTQKDIFLNVTAYKIDMEKMVELSKADQLLKARIKPIVELEYYTVEKDAVQDGKPVMEETTEIRNGKEVIIQRQKKWINHRMSERDIMKTFKVIRTTETPELQKEPEVEFVNAEEAVE